MTYSDKQYAEKIKESYGEEKKSKLDELMRLDRKVKAPVEITALVVGIVGALILGFGMCLAMKVIFDSMALGIVIGLVGILIVSVNYPIYKSRLDARKKKYSSQILKLTDEILSSEQKKQ